MLVALPGLKLPSEGGGVDRRGFEPGFPNGLEDVIAPQPRRKPDPHAPTRPVILNIRSPGHTQEYRTLLNIGSALFKIMTVSRTGYPQPWLAGHYTAYPARPTCRGQTIRMTLGGKPVTTRITGEAYVPDPAAAALFTSWQTFRQSDCRPATRAAASRTTTGLRAE